MRELVTAKQYKEGKQTPFPDEEKLTQEQRNDPMYYVHACNAILSRYINNNCAYPYDNWGTKRSFSELRAYRMGQNNPNKYKGYILGTGLKEVNKGLGIEEAAKRSGERKTTVNISWDVLQILPEKMDVVMGYMQKINYDVDISAIDYQSLIGKKTAVAMAKMYADEQYEFMKQEVNKAAGRELLQDKDPSEMPGGVQFGSPKEVEIAAAVGVFFLEQEAAMQSLLSKSAEDSVAESLNDLYKDDLLTLSVSGKRIYTNQNTNIVLEDYIDPDLAMIPYSVYKDYRDITWGGHIPKWTIGRLRKELKIPEDELIKIAKLYASGNSGTRGYSNFYFNVQRDRNNTDFGMEMMDQIEVDVADCAWFGYKDKTLTSVTREKEGNIALNEVKSDYKLTDKDERKGKKLNTFRSRTVYKAKMVMGTSHVFDYGEAEDIAFERNNKGQMEPIFPFKFVRTGNISLVERCIGFVDDANLSNYKLRVARMKMPAPPNLFIDKSMLENVKIDGVTWSPMKLMRLLQDEGFLIGDSKNQWGQNNGGAKPVNPIGTDVIGQLVAWRQDREDSILMIEKITGINQIFSAQTPDRKEAVGVTNTLMQATQNSLTPIVKAHQYLFEGGERIKVKKWQVVASYITEEERKRLSINRALKTVKIGSDLQDYDFDLKVHAAITDQEKAEMIQDIKDMRNLRRQAGAGGINESDYMLLYNMIKSGKLVQAQLALSQIISSRTKEDQDKQKELVQQNQQSQMASNQQTAQNEQQTNQQEGDIELRNKNSELQTKYKLEMILSRQQHAERMKELAIENIWGRHQKKSA
jgi:hypothetical protein